MKIIEVYTVKVIADCEGRTVKSIAAFTKREDAEHFCTTEYGRDMYGSPGHVSKETYCIYQNTQEAIENSTEHIRKTALGKLTDQEKKVLGL